MPESIYQFTVQDVNGNPISLADYAGKVLLVVNTASQCGFTPQLEELEALKMQFSGEQFEILAFPCNDFGNQEPLTGLQAAEFCSTTFNSTFPVFEKLHVKGENAHPLYRFLADKKRNGRVGIAPKWNFHKYLINQEGFVDDYFFTITRPSSSKIKSRIAKLLRSK